MSDPFAAGALPRLVALDLDGTLLTNDKRLTPRARSAVRALDARGVHVVVCTGRPPRSAVAYAAELGLRHPFVCFNGAALYDPERHVVRVRHHLDAEVARLALARLRSAFPDVMMGLETDHGWYLDEALYRLRGSEARLGPEEPTGVGAVERFLDGGAVKLFARHASADAATMGEVLDGLPLHRTWSSPTMLELLDPRADKRGALQELCAELAIDPAQVAAFGDQHNDVEMLAWAGLGVAVANASLAARQVADLVIGSNEADSVARTLESWLAGDLPGTAHPMPTTGG